MVTVTATDPSGLSATVNVTIKITNVDEEPTIEGMAAVRHAENTPETTAVATYTAMDDEDDKARNCHQVVADVAPPPVPLTSQVVCSLSRNRPTTRTRRSTNNQQVTVTVVATDSDGNAVEMSVTVK